MVQRYDLVGDMDGNCNLNEARMEKSDDGIFVRYSDYIKLEAELQKYKDQFPDYVECANCGSVTHVEGVE